MLRNVASQKWRVFAWDVTTGLAKTGDAAQISAYITIDDGTPAVTNDVAPTEASAANEPGYYDFTLTQAESNGAKVSLSPKSSTSNIQVVAVPAVVYTVPQYASLLGIEADGDLTKVNTLNGHTVQTGDTYALANGATGFAAIDTVVDAVKAKTDNLPTDPADQSLIIAATDAIVTEVNANETKIDSIITAVADVPTVAEFNARTLIAASYFDPATDTVANVTTVGTLTNKTDFALSSTGLNGVVLPANFITASSITASSLNGKGDWNVGKTGYALSSTGMNSVILPANLITALSIASNAITAGKIAASAFASDKFTTTALSTQTLLGGITISGSTIAASGNWNVGKTGYSLVSTGLDTVVLPADFLKAAAFQSGSLNGKGDWLLNIPYGMTIDALSTTVGIAGAGLTNLGGMSTTMKGQVETEANDALVANHLDHLFAADYDPASKPGVATALLNELIEDDAGDSRFTANALEQAPAGGGGGGDFVTLASLTADSGSTTTVVCAALTQADDDFWKGQSVRFTTTTLEGVVREISGFDEGTDTITFTPAAPVAVATHGFEIIPTGTASTVNQNTIISSAGTGGSQLTVTVDDGLGSPLQNAVVRLSEGVNSVFSTTGADGIVNPLFGVSDLTYDVIITKDGYTFAPDTITVSGDGSVTKSMSLAVGVIAATTPGSTTAYTTVYNASLVPVADEDITFTVFSDNDTDAYAILGSSVEATSGANGLLQVTLINGVHYQITTSTGRVLQYRVPLDAGATTALPPIRI